MPGGDIVAYVFGGGDGLAVLLLNRLPTGIDSGTIARAVQGLSPGEKVGSLLWQETSAFFLVEKDDGSRGKVFALGRGFGGRGVVFTKDCRVDARLLGFHNFSV
jgi:hypothetical protein